MSVLCTPMTPKPQSILGIDPGYGRVGYGLIEKNGHNLTLIDYGCIETAAKKPFAERLLDIATLLSQLIDQYKPDAAGVEKLFFAKNKTTAIDVAQARGVILLTLQKNTIPAVECHPSEIKKAVTGHGGATKRDVQEMTKHILSLGKKPVQDDAVDALAVAITASAYHRAM